MALLQQLFGSWVGGVPKHSPPPAGPTPAPLPVIDPDTGCVVIGAADYPREFPTDPAPFDKPGLTVDIEHTAAGVKDRAMYFRNLANPPTSPSAIRTWGAQGSAEIKQGCAADFNCGHPGDLTGWEGAAIHWGSGVVASVCGAITALTNRGGGRIGEAIGHLILFPLNAYPSHGVITKAIGLRVMHRTEGYAEPLAKFGLLVDHLCGNNGLGYDEPAAKLAVNGGVSAGRNEDPGTGYVHGEAGFKTRDGGATKAGVSGTFTTTDGKTITIANGIVVSIV